MPYDFMDVIIAEDIFNEHEANSVLKIIRLKESCFNFLIFINGSAFIPCVIKKAVTAN